MDHLSHAKIAGLSIITCLAIASTAIGQTAPAPTLESLKSSYTNAVAKIATDAQRQKEDALAQYGKNLATIQASLKQKGDIDGYTVVEQEAKRFQAEKTVLTNAPGALVASAVTAYQKQVSAADADSAGRAAGLQQKYISALGNLVKDLMAQDKIAEARAAGDEKKAMESVMSGVESNMPKAQTQAVQSHAVKATSMPVASDKKPVPSDAKERNGHHYMVFADVSDWEGAQTKCRERGGHLVVISDGDENAFVHELMKSHRAAWIGAEKDVGDWRWVTTTPFSYAHWAPEESHKANKKHESTEKNENRSIGNGVKAAMFGNWKGNDKIRGWWFPPNGNEPGGIDAYVCEWDY